MTTDAQVREPPLGDYVDIIVREDSFSGGDVIVRSEIRRETRVCRVPEQWEPKVMMRDSILSTTKYARRRWGPFAWYEKV